MSCKVSQLWVSERFGRNPTSSRPMFSSATKDVDALAFSGVGYETYCSVFASTLSALLLVPVPDVHPFCIVPMSLSDVDEQAPFTRSVSHSASAHA
jgi:hypothetical protein